LMPLLSGIIWHKNIPKSFPKYITSQPNNFAISTELSVLWLS
jgi:hypothetical protein